MTKKCIVCGSKSVSVAFTAKYATYYRCADCTHVFTTKVKSTPYEHYDHIQKYLHWKEYLHNIFLRRCRDVSTFMPSGKVLEVGCSIGFMLDVLMKMGYDARGLEPSPDGVEFCKKRGLRVYRGYLEDEKVPGSPYDVVILNHVFEHLKDPNKGCQHIWKLLRKGGIIQINSPNFGSLEASIYGSKWRFLLSEEHFSQFNPVSIRRVLERNGFEVLLLRTNSVWFDFGDMKQELVRCILHDQKRMLYYLTELPMAILSQILGRGNEVEVIARKIPVTKAS